MDPADLADFVERELSQLPPPRAPRTLLPRVLAAAQEWSSRPWYTRAWFTWPLAWQVVSVAALAALVAGTALLIPTAQAAAHGPLSEITSRVVDTAASSTHRVDALFNTGRVLWRVVLEPLAAYAFVLVLLMCATCAAFGTALNRLAVGRS